LLFMNAGFRYGLIGFNFEPLSRRERVVQRELSHAPLRGRAYSGLMPASLITLA
jgi:hypothetical protein